jgi:hypothetical protein
LGKKFLGKKILGKRFLGKKFLGKNFVSKNFSGKKFLDTQLWGIFYFKNDFQPPKTFLLAVMDIILAFNSTIKPDC